MTVLRYRTNVVAILALMVGVQLVLPDRVSAQETTGGGVGIYPVVIEVNDALRGAEYFRTFTVINREQVDLNLRFTADGEVSSWLTVHPTPDDLGTTLDEIIVPAESEARLILRMTIPDEAANGRYTGGILFQGTAASIGDGQSGVGVSVGIAADIAINVTGEQNMSGSVLDMTVDDAEVDQPPVRLRIQFENDGNVQTRPHIDWQIKDSSGAEVDHVSYDDAVVQPSFVQELIVTWDPTGQPEGTYSAFVRVTLNDTLIDERELSFDLLPVGTLTRSGELDNVYLEGEPEPGTVGKLVAVFRNTGQIDTRATFTAELYFGEQLVEVIESQERLVEVGDLVLLEGFFNVGEAGDYRARGKVLYEGKETSSREIAFEILPVASAPETSQDNPVAVPDAAPVPVPSATTGNRFPPAWGVAGAVGGVVLAILAGAILWRSRRSAPAGLASEAQRQVEGSELQRP